MQSPEKVINNINITDFKGMRNDRGQKYIPQDYFYDIQNMCFDNIVGITKILAPAITYNNSTADNVNGIFEFRYLNNNNKSIVEHMSVIGSNLYTNILSIPTLVYNGLTSSKVTTVIQNNKLLIANGKDYVKIYDGSAVWEMGAPKITAGVTGNLTGQYYYEVTFVFSTVEERLGGKSNIITVNSQQIELELPLGWSGVTARKIYRTTAGGLSPLLVATISDNTTINYSDNLIDSSLGANIIDINNELPKPYFIKNVYEQLIGCVDDKYINQVFVGEANIPLWKPNIYYDISGIGGDNTGLMGMEIDYDRIIIGTKKNIYLMDVSSTVSIIQTRANVGVLDGYTMVRTPNNKDFYGGVMFLSSIGDIRVFNGNIAQPVASSLDNLRTENFSQPIKPDIDYEVELIMNSTAFFYDYKYHICLNDTVFVFDIRTYTWSKIKIVTKNYSSVPNCFGILNNDLYCGQIGAGIIEKYYVDITYRGEDLLAYFQTSLYFSDENIKLIKEVFFHFSTPKETMVQIEYKLDHQANFKTNEMQLLGGSFSSKYFNSLYFQTNDDEETYRVLRINKMARNIGIKFNIIKGYFNLRGINLIFDNIINKEGN